MISVPVTVKSISSTATEFEHIGKLPWPHPYENDEKKFKWHVMSIDQKQKSNGKLLTSSEETFTTEKSISKPLQHIQKGTGSAELYTFHHQQSHQHHPYAFELPKRIIDSHYSSPFSYASADGQDKTNTIQFNAHSDGQVYGAPQQHNSIEYYAMAKEQDDEGDSFYYQNHYQQQFQHQQHQQHQQHDPAFLHIDKK